jgi:hypothetical protein|tara:strand:+ start:917 stop:1048 length:132 start_codon:yes stop_codon:yes gene_type:complete
MGNKRHGSNSRHKPTAKRPAFEGLGVYAGEMVNIIGLENRSKG